MSTDSKLRRPSKDYKLFRHLKTSDFYFFLNNCVKKPKFRLNRNITKVVA